MTQLYINPIGGVAGDMFCAALIDLRPELFDELRQLLPALKPPPGLELGLSDAPGGLHGRCFHVRLPKELEKHHNHTDYGSICRLLDESELPFAVRQRAHAIFLELAKAESRVHGMALEQVTFHEVGNWDSIVDIVSAAYLLERLQVSGCSCEPLPRGGGRVYTQHGWLPVPAPATAYLLEGMEMVDDGISGERVTPTGAAIVRSLKPRVTTTRGQLVSTGYGFGSRQLAGVPNCLQIQMLDDGAEINYQADSVLEITFELDDQNPEDIATGLEHIRNLPGVLSLLVVNALGKLGRPTQQVQIIAEATAGSELVDACFRETRTIGLRHRQTSRWILERRETIVDLAEHQVGVKLNRGPEGWRAKAENRDLNELQGYTQRQQLARLAEEVALAQNQSDE